MGTDAQSCSAVGHGIAVASILKSLFSNICQFRPQEDRHAGHLAASGLLDFCGSFGDKPTQLRNEQYTERTAVSDRHCILQMGSVDI